MKLLLPCLLGSVFPGALENGYRGELKLEGIRFQGPEPEKARLLASPYPMGGLSEVVEPATAGARGRAAAPCRELVFAVTCIHMQNPPTASEGSLFARLAESAPAAAVFCG